jgi:hypothetical protein
MPPSEESHDKAMTRKEELRAVEEMNEEQVGRILAVIENERQAASGEQDRTGRQQDLSRFYGVMQLTEDPAGFQERMRSEWA